MWKNNRSRLMAAFMGALLLLPALSYADTVDPSRAPFQLAEKDYFLGILLKNFLGIVPNGASATMGDVLSGSGTLGEIFRTFNLGIAFFGTLMITFITVVGVVQSGNDGEFLGKRWSSFWVPVRFATGSALMLPVTSSGYSVVQIMILYIAAQGVAFGDTLWSKIVDVVVERTGAQVWGNVDGETVAQQVMLGSICTAASNYYGKLDGSVPEGYPVTQRSSSGWTTGTDQNGREKSKSYYLYWSQNDLTEAQLLAGKAKCGSVRLVVSRNDDDVYKEARQRIAETHASLVEQMANSFAPKAQDFIQKVETADLDALTQARSDLQKAMADAGAAYRQAIASSADAQVAAARSTQQGLGASSDQMKRYGFVTAGMFYLDLTRVHGAVRQAMTATPTYIAGPGLNGVQNYELALASFRTISPYLSTTEMTAPVTKQGTVNVSNSAKDIITVDGSDSTIEPTAYITHTVSKMGAYVIQTMFGVGNSNTGTDGGTFELFAGNRVGPNLGASNNTSSVLELKNKGDQILDIAGFLIVGKTMIVGASTVAESAGNALPSWVGFFVATPGKLVKAVLQDLGAYILSAVFMLIAFGLSLAVYVPMVPYMLWIGGIIGLVLLIAEALVAGPLWAVMIMHPSGEGLTSQQSERGMMLLLGLFTRPALMLMGLVMGMFMLEPLVTLVNDTFYYTMSSVQVSTISGLFSLFGFCTLYVSLILTVVNKCFSMIHIVPDKALRWISGGGEQLGENALRDHAKGNMGAVASVVGKMAMENGGNRGKEKAPKPGKGSWGD
jgi:conjugal transfer/type IV secretion protein DotA/TraY